MAKFSKAGILLILASISLSYDTPEYIKQEKKVYICSSEGATKYHLNKNCRGLNSCNHAISYISISDAKKKGKKTLCGWED